MPLDQQGFVIGDTETKADPFTLDALISWLKNQPARKPYVWFTTSDCNGGCLLHQYLIAHRLDPTYDYRKLANVGGYSVLDVSVAMPEPHTFGAALARALALKAEQ